jgi:hypothetical protein
MLAGRLSYLEAQRDKLAGWEPADDRHPARQP